MSTWPVLLRLPLVRLALSESGVPGFIDPVRPLKRELRMGCDTTVKEKMKK